MSRLILKKVPQGNLGYVTDAIVIHTPMIYKGEDSFPILLFTPDSQCCFYWCADLDHGPKPSHCSDKAPLGSSKTKP